MGVLVYYLVVYPEVQSRLQEEIDDLFDGKDEGEDLTQDDITGMAYLDQVPVSIITIIIIISTSPLHQVLNEGNRLGSVSSTARMCTKDYPIPGDSFVIPKNTRVIIPCVSQISVAPFSLSLTILSTDRAPPGPRLLAGAKQVRPGEVQQRQQGIHRPGHLPDIRGRTQVRQTWNFVQS